MITEPTISVKNAKDVCAEPFLTEADAHEQALLLQRGGWIIEWRNQPYPEFGIGSGIRIAATVHHPDPDSEHRTVGDIMFRLETEL